MRIAMVSETYPPEVNGAGITVRDWVRGLRGLGHEVQLIRPWQPKVEAKGADRVDEFGAEHVLVKGVPLISYPGLRAGLPAKRRLVKLWRQRRPDVIHVATEGLLGYTALRAAKKLGIPATSSFHTNFHEYAKHYGFRPFGRIAAGYLRFVHQRSDNVIVATDDIAASVKTMGIPHVGVMPRGVDTQRFHPGQRSRELRASWGADEDTLVVGYVGRLADEKSIPDTFAVYEAIRARVPCCSA
jgi:glycosyltransferase involved in cell wall biosynthesis